MSLLTREGPSLRLIELSHWSITQKLFFGSGTEKILYMPSDRALKMLSFGSYVRCIGARWGVGEQKLSESAENLVNGVK